MKIGGTRRCVVIVVVGAAALACILFSIPFKSVPYYELETYTDTEIRQEPYTASEPYISRELVVKEDTLFNNAVHSVPYGINVQFNVTEAGSKLTGNFQLPAPGGFYLYGSAGQLIYEQRGESGNFEFTIAEGSYKANLLERARWEGMLYLDLKLTWTETEEVVKYREATRYREVLVTVEKERTVTHYRKVPLWRIIFGKH